MNFWKLTGKVAVLTGASKGIGAATARPPATECAAVVVRCAFMDAPSQSGPHVLLTRSGNAGNPRKLSRPLS